MHAAGNDVSHADDIMSARAIYALIGSLVVGVLLWSIVLALIV